MLSEVDINRIAVEGVRLLSDRRTNLSRYTHERMLNSHEAAKYIGMSESWLNSHLDDIPHVKVGRLNRFIPSKLDSFIKRE